MKLTDFVSTLSGTDSPASYSAAAAFKRFSACSSCFYTASYCSTLPPYAKSSLDLTSACFKLFSSADHFFNVSSCCSRPALLKSVSSPSNKYYLRALASSSRFFFCSSLSFLVSSACSAFSSTRDVPPPTAAPIAPPTKAPPGPATAPPVIAPPAAPFAAPAANLETACTPALRPAYYAKFGISLLRVSPNVFRAFEVWLSDETIFPSDIACAIYSLAAAEDALFPPDASP